MKVGNSMQSSKYKLTIASDISVKLSISINMSIPIYILYIESAVALEIKMSDFVQICHVVCFFVLVFNFITLGSING